MPLPPPPTDLPPVTSHHLLLYRPGARSNLLAAERAVQFASDKLRGRSSNRPEDIVHTLQHNLRAQYGHLPSAVANNRIQDDLSSLGGFGFNEIMQQKDQIYMERNVAIDQARKGRDNRGQKFSAPDIWKANIGNCFEHAVLACHYLKKSGIPSYIAETDDITDHAFVLIDSPGGLDGQTVYVTRNAPGAIAGAFTVVCDPWYHEWFSVQQDWGRKMWHIFGVTTKIQPTANQVPLKLTSEAHIFP